MKLKQINGKLFAGELFKMVVLMIILGLAALIFLAFTTGCTGNKYEHTKFHPDTGIIEKWTLEGYGANITKETEGLMVIMSDGSIMILGKHSVLPDPNSAKAIGEAFGAGARAFIFK